jgi:SAM-dependent methyltransferase
MTSYDSSFFAYVNSGSLISAERLLPFLLNKLETSSVLDVGCGQGAWLSVWKKHGVDDIVGVDGDYVDREELLIPETLFKPFDLNSQFDLNRKFDLVQCLEVAEHLPHGSAAQLVASLCAHSELVLFSAAPPGQGGDNHVNEQPYDYWRKLFMQHGYDAYDYVRPLVADDHAIEPWYRFNVFLYASKKGVEDLPPAVSQTLVPPDNMLRDISPRSYQARMALVRVLPVAAMTWLAKVKESLVTRIRAESSTEG